MQLTSLHGSLHVNDVCDLSAFEHMHVNSVANTNRALTVLLQLPPYRPSYSKSCPGKRRFHRRGVLQLLQVRASRDPSGWCSSSDPSARDYRPAATSARAAAPLPVSRARLHSTPTVRTVSLLTYLPVATSQFSSHLVVLIVSDAHQLDVHHQLPCPRFH